MSDHPSLPIVDLDSLLDAVLPDISSHVEAVCDKLATEEVNAYDMNTDRWTAVGQMNPAARSEVEGDVFQFVGAIWNATMKALPTELTNTVDLTVDGNKTPETIVPNTGRPDGGGFLRGEPGVEQYSFLQMFLTLEFKKKDTPKGRIDDGRKIMWAIHHLLRNDARRRFAFGLSIENTAARFWFSDRQSAVVSTEFDINEDWKKLVRIFVAIGTASMLDLGYDATIRLHSLESTVPVYDYDVYDSNHNKRTFRTVRVLSDVGTNLLNGRGCRVEVVREVIDGQMEGEEMALKDVWMNADRVPEHTHLQNIRGSLLADDRMNDLRHFLTCETAGWVPVSDADVETVDNTYETIRRRLNFVVQGVCELILPVGQTTSTSTSTSTPGSIGATPTAPPPFLRGHRNISQVNSYPRGHYRFVFEEVGLPLYKDAAYGAVFSTLRDALVGLGAMHKYGLMHGDLYDSLFSTKATSRDFYWNAPYTLRSDLAPLHAAVHRDLTLILCKWQEQILDEKRTAYQASMQHVDICDESPTLVNNGLAQLESMIEKASASDLLRNTTKQLPPETRPLPAVREGGEAMNVDKA
ncbi:hypothetical protein FA95DRAFT_1578083 [Auriscalpium vulgare]|uniref:Uncharacterized protein n=1 Tax=Auriscalpium vulgare TaxID=40419 RepID=A0ACB8R502_9AGAM|nr:hypothetical protein FA95DRAFT_1578083 [Auriscalpium vulgare]